MPSLQEVAAWPIFVHPIHNFSVVRFDPSRVKGNFDAAVLASRESEDDDQLDQQQIFQEPRQPRRPAPSRASQQQAPSTGGEPGPETGQGAGGGRGGRRPEGSGNGFPEAATSRVRHAPQDREASSSRTASSAVEAADNDDMEDDLVVDDDEAIEADAATAADYANGVVDASSEGKPGTTRDLSPPPLRPGDAAEFHGLTSANAPVRQRTVVVKLERLALASSSHPQFTAHSVEVSAMSAPGVGEGVHACPLAGARKRGGFDGRVNPVDDDSGKIPEVTLKSRPELAESAVPWHSSPGVRGKSSCDAEASLLDGEARKEDRGR